MPVAGTSPVFLHETPPPEGGDKPAKRPSSLMEGEGHNPGPAALAAGRKGSAFS